MANSLQSLYDALVADPGLQALPASQLANGLAAAAELNRILLLMINQTGVNNDGLITPEDMQTISDAIWRPANAQPWREFWLAHGNDSGTVETGYHLLQNDGGTLEFRGRNFVDTIADSIYHFGFQVQDGNYFNEDGNTNAALSDVAGWLNYFLNGRSAVFGTDEADSLGTSDYDAYFAAARSETFYAGGGNDQIWSGIGSDRVYGGAGNDRVGAGDGADRVFGEAGHDTLYGEAGNDLILGAGGDDVIGGGADLDTLQGGLGNDTIYGDDGDDQITGEDGFDVLHGGAGRDRLDGGLNADRLYGGNDGDRLLGGGGNDTLSAGEGADLVIGGAGGDLIQLWETVQVVDTVALRAGESGTTRATIDRIEGFESGTDRFDLSSLGVKTLEDLDYRRDGQGSCYYDGHFLRIDADGDARTDLIVEFAWTGSLTAADFIFA